ESYGCGQSCRLSQIEYHEQECQFHPERIIECPHGCGTVMKRKQLADHSCIDALKKVIRRKNKRIRALKAKLRRASKGREETTRGKKKQSAFTKYRHRSRRTLRYEKH